MLITEVREAKKIILGDILVSDDINSALKKWGNLFGFSQVEVAKWMGIASSVISEYENDRRRRPGSRFLRRFVDALVDMDLKRGGRVIYMVISGGYRVEDETSILLLKEFRRPINASVFIKAVDGEVITGRDMVDTTYIYGFTIIDSLKAILTLSGDTFYRLFGRTTERALVFTNVSTGRSPMVAVRVYPIKPRMVVIHRPRRVDKLSIMLAEKERLIYVLSRIDDVEDLKLSLLNLNKSINGEGPDD